MGKLSPNDATREKASLGEAARGDVQQIQNEITKLRLDVGAVRSQVGDFTALHNRVLDALSPVSLADSRGVLNDLLAHHEALQDKIDDVSRFLREQSSDHWPSGAATPRETAGEDPSASPRSPDFVEELGQRLSYLPEPPCVGSAALPWTSTKIDGSHKSPRSGRLRVRSTTNRNNYLKRGSADTLGQLG